MTTLSNTALNAAADAVVDLLDGGSVVLLTAADAEVATIGLGTPAFGAAAAGVATANATTEDSNTNAGTVAKASVRNAGDVEVMQCTVSVTGGGGEVQLPSLTFAAGEAARITSFTYTQNNG